MQEIISQIVARVQTIFSQLGDQVLSLIHI